MKLKHIPNILSVIRILLVFVFASGTRSGSLRKGQYPFELLGGLLGFLSRRSRGLKHCVESVPETEDSSPVLTWNLEYF